MNRPLAIVVVVMLTPTFASAATEPAPVDPLIDAAVAAVEAGAIVAFAATVDKAASEAMVDPMSADLPHIVQLATLSQFARWFARVEQPSAEQKSALAWLVRQRRVAPALMLSATDADPPDRVLAILTALHQDYGDRLEQFPELTAAVCLVWDDPDRSGGEGRPLDTSGPLRVFRYYADNPAATRNAAAESSPSINSSLSSTTCSPNRRSSGCAAKPRR